MNDPHQSSVHQVFRENALRTPDSVAVVDRDAATTYRELDLRSNHVAHRLRELGIGPGSFVPLVMERSTKLTEIVLGVLKAGGAYAPLPPHYPSAQLRSMIEDLNPGVIISDPELEDCLPRAGIAATRVRSNSSDLCGQSDTPPSDRVAASDPCYVMFTSGTTGTPNGVIIPHRSVLHLVSGRDYFPFGPEQRLLFQSAFAFDASTFELWGALLHGARLVVSPYIVPTGSLVEREGVTGMFLTTALFNLVIDQAPAVLTSARTVLFGGEPASVRHVHKALQALPRTQLVNVYGPTETTTFATTYRVPRELDPGTERVPIGRPFGSGRVYVLDPDLRPAPDGEAGELYIAGDGLGVGYLNRPELTAKRFVVRPVDDGPDTRLYRTGDYVRRRPDGAIEFLGRADNQVKIRGMRIELEAIEAALLTHPGVMQCAVAAHGTGRESGLTAYVKAGNSDALAHDDLREHLTGRLPAHMLPGTFICLSAIPRTPQGKIDRSALSEIRGQPLQGDCTRNQVERV